MQLYQPLNIYVVLVGVEVWTDGDRMSVLASDSGATLDKFLAYRRSSINPHHHNDNAQLITCVLRRATLSSQSAVYVCGQPWQIYRPPPTLHCSRGPANPHGGSKRAALKFIRAKREFLLWGKHCCFKGGWLRMATVTEITYFFSVEG